MSILIIILAVFFCACALALMIKQGRISHAFPRLEIRLNCLNEQLDKLMLRFEEREQQQQHELRQMHTILQDAATLQQQWQKDLLQEFANYRLQLQSDLFQQRQSFEQQQLQGFKLLQESLQLSVSDLRKQIVDTLTINTATLDKRVEKLTQEVNSRLSEISGQVEKRLSDGFEKTTATFTDVIKRLALIDEAQKKITELSSNVVSLQQILADKRSRGAFGEVQLNSLVRNMLPENAFSLQHMFANGKRADCVLYLPEPTGNIVIDAKFPLESYQKMTVVGLPETERRIAEKQFKQDILKHIQDIASKYIIPGETSDGAVMFIPAEAVFAEIHSHYPELVEASHQLQVWMVSPTTLMAVLTTARAVVKDAATRKQVHIIREHLGYLAKDFERFQSRMNTLAKHIDLAQADVKHVKTSADKISSRFGKIEKVDLSTLAMTELDLPIDDSTSF